MSRAEPRDLKSDMGRVQASIDLCGTTLRYAAVEVYDTHRRLLRLGSCDFDFDVLEVLSRPTAPDSQSIFTEALGDIFEGAPSEQLHVVLHPDSCPAFLVPLPGGLAAPDRQARLEQDAALLTRTTTAHLATSFVRAEAVGTTEHVEWVHVLLVPERIRRRFHQLTAALPFSDFQWNVSMQGAARAIRRLAPEEPAYTLVLGRYADHTEYVLCRGRQWQYSHYVTAPTPADSAYFARALTERMGVAPEAVERILVYGPEGQVDALTPFHRVLGAAPESLDPMPLVDFDSNNMAADFDPGVYLPCIGALL